MGDTRIEWATKVWNPVTGCTKVSPGCAHCYAEGIAHRFWGERPFTEVRYHDDRLEIPFSWKKPQRIFVNSMSDLFHPDVPFEFVDEVFAVMALCPWHTFMVLTKRPARMLEYYRSRENGFCDGPDEKAYDFEHQFWDNQGECHLPKGWAWVCTPDPEGHDEHTLEYEGPLPLPNVWVGVSAENQRYADERLPILVQIPAAVRFLSAEPLLGGITRIPEGLHWIICGGESGPDARPMNPAWARTLRDQCRQTHTPFFFKQWGEWAPYPPAIEGQGNLGPRGAGDHYHWFDLEKARPDMWRVGKKAAGCLLDSQEWKQFPQGGVYAVDRQGTD